MKTAFTKLDSWFLRQIQALSDWLDAMFGLNNLTATRLLMTGSICAVIIGTYLEWKFEHTLTPMIAYSVLIPGVVFTLTLFEDRLPFVLAMPKFLSMRKYSLLVMILILALNNLMRLVYGFVREYSFWKHELYMTLMTCGFYFLSCTRRPKRKPRIVELWERLTTPDPEGQPITTR